MTDTIMVYMLWLFERCVNATEDCYDIIIEQQVTSFNFKNNQDVIKCFNEFSQPNNKLIHLSQLLNCLRKKINVNTGIACNYNPMTIVKGIDGFNFQQYNSTHVCKYFRKLYGKYNYLTKINLCDSDHNRKSLKFYRLVHIIMLHFYGILEILFTDMKLMINNK